MKKPITSKPANGFDGNRSEAGAELFFIAGNLNKSLLKRWINYSSAKSV